MIVVLKSWLINQLRRASYKWPERTKALGSARVERGVYKCNICSELFKSKEIQLDHIEPIVPVTGFDNWDGYIARLFCPAEGFQVCCRPCHDSKTQKENATRKIKKQTKNKKRLTKKRK